MVCIVIFIIVIIVFKKKTRYEFETDKSNTFKFTFACFDNINQRGMFYNWLSMNYTNENEHALFIDCRLGFEYFQIYCVKMKRWYWKDILKLFDDSGKVHLVV